MILNNALRVKTFSNSVLKTLGEHSLEFYCFSVLCYWHWIGIYTQGNIIKLPWWFLKISQSIGQLFPCHCVKSLRIWSFSSPYFPIFGLKRKRYGVSLCIHPECGKKGPEKLPIRTFFTQRAPLQMNLLLNVWVHIDSEAYSEHCQTSKMGRFAKIVNCF